ncbi:MAG TPA: hypothetical protein VFO29_05735 [Candidatus Rubrimentiphilum sp.]|nr:hypothetical protein [Candidatus Rubrimentiphilum sp.]
MFGTHREAHSRTAILRDIVEIVAIILAGAWAIYVFIYVERVKPVIGEPRVLLTGSLQRVGAKGDLTALEYTGSIRNAGLSTVYLIATAVTATGVRFTTQGTPANVTMFNGSLTQYLRDARVSSRSTVYRVVNLTRFVKPSYGGGFGIAPGESIPFSGIFLVPRKDFDEITLDASIAYSKVEHTFPTTVKTNPLGVALLQSTNHDPDYFSLQVTLARTMLW